jgi:hypothetical protein
MFMGRIAEMTRRLPVLLKEAEERDDLYAMMNLTLTVGTFARLAADEPRRARQDIEQAMARWSRQGFHVQHLNRLHDEVLIDIYEGEVDRAWNRLQADWPTLANSHFFRVQQVRITMWHLRARAALAAASRAADPRPFLQAAEADARRLERENIAWSVELARLVRAGAAVLRKQPDAALLLREAAAGLEAVHMTIYAVAARQRLGRLLGGDEGTNLVAQAEAWMKDQRVENPSRFGELLAPGLAG